jgi:hypothetical protein
MPAKPERILLVEGREDREVIFHLCNHHGLDNRSLFEVIPKDGYENLRDDLRVRPRTFGHRAIGAIIDADANIALRWRSVCDALGACGYTGLPPAPDEQGTIISPQGPLPRIGLWLMPDNRLSGMLEDFIQQLIRQGDALLPHAQGSVDGIPPTTRRFQEVHRTKAIIHTWLAWQEEPGTPLGQAVTKHYLDADHELARRFLAWLRNLFSPANAPGATS